MHTKIMQNTKFVYIFYAKIVQIKILCDDECTKNVHQIPAYIQKMYKPSLREPIQVSLSTLKRF